MGLTWLLCVIVTNGPTCAKRALEKTIGILSGHYFACGRRTSTEAKAPRFGKHLLHACVRVSVTNPLIILQSATEKHSTRDSIQAGGRRRRPSSSKLSKKDRRTKGRKRRSNGKYGLPHLYIAARELKQHIHQPALYFSTFSGYYCNQRWQVSSRRRSWFCLARLLRPRRTETNGAARPLPFRLLPSENRPTTAPPCSF